MPRFKWPWAIVPAGLCVAIALVGAWFFLGRANVAPSTTKIAVLSSVPLQWGEADIAAIAQGQGRPDPLIARLSQAGTVSFADSVAQIQAARPDIALLIQPRALSPDEMVRLDKWVRAGGRLLLFADPALQWPSEQPIGDQDRPLFTSLLSPLFQYWGLELAFPMDAEGAVVAANLSDHDVKLASPGIWQAIEDPKGSANCRVDLGRYMAECRPGKGQAILVADADMLEASMWQSAIPGVDTSDNIEWLIWALGRLRAGERVVGRDGI